MMKNRIEEIRKEKGIKQDEFAKLMGVSRQTISSLETGKYNPSIFLAYKLLRMSPGTPIFPKKGKTNFPHFSRIFPRSKQVSSACFSFLCFGNFLRNHNFPCTKKKRLFKNLGSIVGN